MGFAGNKEARIAHEIKEKQSRPRRPANGLDRQLRTHTEGAEFVLEPPRKMGGPEFGFMVFTGEFMNISPDGKRSPGISVSACYRSCDGDLYHNSLFRKTHEGKPFIMTQFIIIKPEYIEPLIAAIRKVAGKPEVAEKFSDRRLELEKKVVEKSEDDEVDKLMKQLGGRI